MDLQVGVRLLSPRIDLDQALEARAALITIGFRCASDMEVGDSPAASQ